MRLIVLLAIVPFVVRAQYPHRSAAIAPGEFSRGLPVQAHSAARPPRGPAPLGSRSLGPGFLNGTGDISNNSPGASRSQSSGRHDRQSLPLGYVAPFYYPFADYGSSSYGPSPYDAPE